MVPGIILGKKELERAIMDVVDTALQLAITFHNGEVNTHNGEPYMLHLQRVYIAVREAGYSEKYQAVAWLHDSLEDTELDLEALQGAMRGNEDVVSSVLAITHNPKESYDDYVRRARLDPMARVVKRYDLLDNFRRNHLIEDEATRLRMAKKYSSGLDILIGSL